MDSTTETSLPGPGQFGVFVSHITEEAHLALEIKPGFRMAIRTRYYRFVHAALVEQRVSFTVKRSLVQDS